MLGYVKIYRPELKVREYEVYNGYYCGICKSIGRRYGQLPRMALSYDAAFLALLLSSLSPEPDEPRSERCIAHHIRKRTVIGNRFIDYAADVMLLTAWHKLADDSSDEGRLSAKMCMAAFRRTYGKLSDRHPSLCRDMEDAMAELSSLEEEKCSSLDAAAEPFAGMMRTIYRAGAGLLPEAGEDTAECLADLGYHSGKWIYLIDAADDLEQDISSGSYNPLIYRYSLDTDRESPGDFRKRIDGMLRFNLFHYLAVSGDILDRLPVRKNRGIIENVIYLGLNRKTEEVLQRTDKKERI